jgi:hypothetical protein
VPAAGPVIVLTYSYAGSRQLQMILERQPSLACTTGTGILGACDAVARAWRNAEDSDLEGMSSLAVNSIRSLASSMLTVVMVRTGARRWCETAAADASAAETFLRAFPGTKFICLQRSCPDVVHAALWASPWGISGGAFASYLLQQPTNVAAALAAWWADSAEPILDFEARHQQSCLRVRYEDLARDPDTTLASIFEFIGLVPEAEISGPAEPPVGAADAAAGPPAADAGFPSRQLPPMLLERINALHAKLDYPALSLSP